MPSIPNVIEPDTYRQSRRVNWSVIFGVIREKEPYAVCFSFQCNPQCQPPVLEKLSRGRIQTPDRMPWVIQ